MKDYEKQMEKERIRAKKSGKYSRDCIHWQPTVPLSRGTMIEYQMHLGKCEIYGENMICGRVDATECPKHQKGE